MANPITWKVGAAGGTPLSAANLNTLSDSITEAKATAASAQTTAQAAQAAASAPNLAAATGSLSADRLTAGTTNVPYSLADRNKLAGVDSGATANSTDAQIVAAARDAVGAAVVAGTAGATYNSTTGAITVPAGSGGGGTSGHVAADDPDVWVMG